MCCHALVLFVGLSQLLPLQRVFSVRQVPPLPFM